VPARRRAAAGLRFAAKDIYDVAGHVTGCGNPDWLATHPPATAHAAAVERLLAAGADLIGKTITDELAYSLNGQNFHYGTPVNSNAPGRIPCGSSSGSAAAVAGAAADFALGSDTGGSVRVPAAVCGIYGIRPSHGRVAIDGVMPLAASFDTVGWFARDARVLARVGGPLLGEDTAHIAGGAARIVDAFALAAPAVRRRSSPWRHGSRG
jgi:Asp-tRNAAsn/Glu-tRNAGln amidotransferase A subunit and related amidases